jgi:hypothetical protein
MPAAALALALAGCAVPPPAPEPPLPYPPAAAERVLRLALDEWREWGGVVREAWAPQPPGNPEAEPANFPRVLAYWRAVEEDEGAIRGNRPRYRAVLAGAPGDGTALWSEPAWSAAFISWVFRTAGVDAREFPPNATHSLYLDGLIADAGTFPATAPFLPHAPEEYAPAPGDLVCLDRGRQPLRHWTERLAETGRPRPMHCDIVVRTARDIVVRTARDIVVRTARDDGVRTTRDDGTGTAPGLVEAVGGNVADTVALTRYPVGPDGRLLPSPTGRLPVVLVMESRLGRLPPWSPR